MPQSTWTWLPLAADGPPGLVTNQPAASLTEKQTPDSTGLSLVEEGFIAASAVCPTGTTRTVATGVGTLTAYTWLYNRLWLASSAKLLYGAPEYTGTFFRQDIGEVDFRNESANVLAFMPIGTGGLIVFKAGGLGAYIIPNAADQSGRFVVSDYLQEVGIAAATDAAELDGVVYFHRSNRMFSVSAGGEVQDIGYPVRGTTLTGAVKCDYAQKLVVLGSAFAYDVKGKRWMKYDGSTTLFTSRALVDPLRAPISVNGIAFDYEFTDTANAVLVYSVRYDARAWGDDQTVTLQNTRGSHNYTLHQPGTDTGTQFQMRITTLPSNVKIRTIYAQVSGYTPESRRS